MAGPPFGATYRRERLGRPRVPGRPGLPPTSVGRSAGATLSTSPDQLSSDAEDDRADESHNCSEDDAEAFASGARVLGRGRWASAFESRCASIRDQNREQESRRLPQDETRPSHAGRKADRILPWSRRRRAARVAAESGSRGGDVVAAHHGNGLEARVNSQRAEQAANVV